MKVIFLDIDGVLTNRNNNRPSFYGLDEVNVALLSILVEQTNAKLILSSTWRMAFDAHMHPLSSAAQGFIQAFDTYHLALYDQTSHLSGGRGKEVFHWLEKHDSIESFVILDDTEFAWGVLAPYWVRVDSKTGLTEKNIADAMKLLTP